MKNDCQCEPGEVMEPEWSEFTDPRSSLVVKQLTRYLGHSYHLYFTNPGWFDGGNKLLFGSERHNEANLFSIDLRDGHITRMTSLEQEPGSGSVNFQGASVNPVRDEAYFWHGKDLTALDLHTFESWVVYELPTGYKPSLINCTADGKHACAGIFKDLSNKFPIDLERGYVGFNQMFSAHPDSKIIVAARDGSGARIAWEERNWIGHVNTSPAHPTLLTFCHEGPWGAVDNRIWGLDLAGGEPWKIRPREEHERVGHEYWYKDGETIGYHGQWATGKYFLGHVRFDNTGKVEVDFPGVTGHVHSNDSSMIVGDGGNSVRIWHWKDGEYQGPYCLCEHRSSGHIQHTHVHPCFTPAGNQVLFTSDRTGYGNLHVVEVPTDVESLPFILWD